MDIFLDDVNPALLICHAVNNYLSPPSVWSCTDNGTEGGLGLGSWGSVVLVCVSGFAGLRIPYFSSQL